MKLTYFRTDPSNFGDELNAYLWEKLLPAGFLDEDASELFVGIGSILGEVYPATSRKIVMGSGYAGYVRQPDLASGMWNIIFVRGPKTAATLDLPKEKSICDSAVLLRALPELPAPEAGIGVGFMPHYQSLARGHWDQVCKKAGVTLIDPTLPPDEVLAKIRGASLVITEAMHGAIVADALRRPWIAIEPFHGSHRMKWGDWGASLDMEVQFSNISPSSVLEYVTQKTGKSGLSPKMRRIFGPPHMSLPDAICIRRAARDLRLLAQQPGTLSSDQAIKDVTARALAALDAFLAQRGVARVGGQAGAVGVQPAGSSEMTLAGFR